MNGETSAPIDIPVSSGHETSYHMGARREVDGGARIAGGRPGECAMDNFDQESTSDRSILPPSYSSDFGETW